MRSFITLGVLSVVGAVAFVGCGDDDGDGGGTAGRAGSAGSAGMAGSAGAGGAGGSGGTGGRGGTGGGGTGGAGPAVTCTGCIELDIPFTAAAQSALYQIAHPAPGLDYSDAVITWKVQVLTPNAGFAVHPQVQNGAFNNYQGYYAGPTVPLTAANFPAGVFTDVTLDMSTVPGLSAGDAGPDGGDDDAGAAAPTAFDKSRIEALQLQILGTAAGTGPATVVVDAVTVTGVTGFTGADFNAGLQGFTLNNYAGSPTPPGTPAPVHHP